MSQEKRLYPRVKVNWPVTINTPQGPIAGVMKNISAGGAFVCIRKSLKPDEELLLSNSHVCPSMSRLSIGTKVTRQNIEQLDNETISLNMGVQFTKLSGEARKLISEHVSTHLKREGLESETAASP
jgi:c-di-GMP-binding flagellar brake protein YcgR